MATKDELGEVEMDSLFRPGGSASTNWSRAGIVMDSRGCAAWMSTVCPLDMADEEEEDDDASLCPADALDMCAWRDSVGLLELDETDSNTHSLLSFSHILHFLCPLEPA